MEEQKDILITQAGCAYCEEAEELLQELIQDKKLEVIPIESPWGARLADKYDIDSTPTIIRREKGEMKKCFVNFEEKVIECEDGSKTKIPEFQENPEIDED